MIRIAVAITAAVLASAQQAPLTFDSGKSLPLAAGNWSFAVTASGNQASYGPHLRLHCDRPTRTVTITRPGTTAAALTIITDVQARVLPPNGRLSAFDPLLDAMAFSRGRILVSGGATGVLAVPSWPEAARAIEDCRN